MDPAFHNRKRCFVSRIGILIAAVFVLNSIACHNGQEEIRILFTGDILLSRNVLKEIEKRKTSPWEKLKPIFQNADLVFGNLEGAVGEPEQDAVLLDSVSPVFAIPSASIPLLKEAGFDAVSIENNHSSDLGENGKYKTFRELLNHDMVPVQFNNSPRFFTIKGQTIAIVALNLVKDRNQTFQELPSVNVRQKLRLARELANLVVVYIHWGSELLQWPNRSQREAAEWLVKNGADLIIGSHPHVIQEPEMINGKPVFFSLGNHLFDQKYPGTKKGLIVECVIRNGKFTCKGIFTHASKNSFYPKITENKDYGFRSISQKKNLEVSDFTIVPKSIDHPNEYKIILQAYKNRKKMWQTYPKPIRSVSAGNLDGAKEYLLTLEDHYSSMDKEISLRPYVYSVSGSGLVDRWRGTALAWPLLDAVVSPDNPRYLYALHRGDSYINLNPGTQKTRISVYCWNGFGFNGIESREHIRKCNEYFFENQ